MADETFPKMADDSLTDSRGNVPNFDSDAPLTEMGRAGLEFVSQFELESVLGTFEGELLKVAVEKGRRPLDPPETTPGG